MQKRIDETLNNSIKKTHYNNFFIKQKKSNTNILNKNKKNKLNKIRNIYPLTFCFTPDEKNNNKFFNKKEVSGNYLLNNRINIKYKNIQKENKIKIIKKKLSFNKIYANNTFESNNKIINENNLNNDNRNNLVIEHKKINFLKFLNSPKTEGKKNDLKNKSYINFETAKYKTIFTKNNTKYNNNIIIPQEPIYYFEKFSSKYNYNTDKNKNNISKSNKPKNLFMNEEINKAAFNKFPFYIKRKHKYYKTEGSLNSNTNTFLESKTNYIHFPSLENIKNFDNTKILRTKNNIKINLKLILQKIKNNSINNITISNKLLNNKNDKNNLSLEYRNKYKSKSLKKEKCYKKSNGVKYSAINLNMLAQIPNRIMPIDNHGNELNGFNSFRSYKNKLIKSKNIKFNTLKQSFGDIKILRKQIFDIYHSNEITRYNSKKNLDGDILKTKMPKNKMFKTFYKSSISDLNDKDISNIKNNKRKRYFLSGKLIRRTKKNFVNLENLNKIEILLI